MFVRTYPQVSANAPNLEGISIPAEMSPAMATPQWETLPYSFANLDREIQVEMDRVGADEVVVKGLKRTPP
jgi:hypothetical protein